MNRKAPLALILIATCPGAIANNLFQNSAFDSNANHWDLSENSRWSATQNSPTSAADHGGALLIDTSVIDYAEQCTEVMPRQSYLLKLDTLNNSAESEWCTTSYFGAELTWWSGKTCDFKLVDDEPLFFQVLEGQDPYAWIKTGGWLTTPDQAHSVRLTLSAECLSHRGTTKMYFDNVEFLTDDIFAAGFDSK